MNRTPNPKFLRIWKIPDGKTDIRVPFPIRSHLEAKSRNLVIPLDKLEIYLLKDIISHEIEVSPIKDLTDKQDYERISVILNDLRRDRFNLSKRKDVNVCEIERRENWTFNLAMFTAGMSFYTMSDAELYERLLKFQREYFAR